MKNIKKIISILILLLLSAKLMAQDNTMYMLHQLPQANILNPAVDFPCKSYIELPILSSTKFAYNNSTFGYKDLIRPGAGLQQDSLIFDVDNVHSKAWRNNYIHFELENVIAGVGFHWKDYFVSARISHDFHALFSYTKDLLEVRNGNWDSNTDSPINYSFKGNELNEVSYWRISLAASRDYSSDLRVGARLSYLKGTSAFNTRKSVLDINTTEQPVAVDIINDYEVNASFPMQYERDTDGRIHSLQPVFNNIVSDFIFNSNRGVALDIGAVYQYSSETTLAASLLNVGFIRWGSNALNLQTEGSLHIEGIDFDNYTQYQNTDLVQLLRDTINSSFRYQDQEKKFTTLLPMTLMAGGTYKLNDITRFDLTGKVYYFSGTTIPSLTGSINVKPLKFANLSLSISYANRTIRNLGFATILGGKTVHFYFVTDMIPFTYTQETSSGAIFPYNARSFNFRFGFNLMFGCGNKSKKYSNGKICPAYR